MRPPRRVSAPVDFFSFWNRGERAGAVWALVVVLGLCVGVSEAQAQRASGGSAPKQRAAPDDARAAGAGLATLLDSVRVDVGMLIQSDLDYSEDPQATAFQIRAARLRMKAESRGMQAFIQTEFKDAPAIFDARLRIPLHERVEVTAGLYKSPFSASFLTSRIVIPLVERARAVNRIAPNRQIGASLGVDVVPERLQVEAGAYNGTGTSPGNDNRLFLYVARADLRVPIGGVLVRAGANGAASVDDGAEVRATGRPFRGRRMAGGIDASVSRGDWLLSAELLGVRLDPADGTGEVSAWGGYVTAGAPLTDRVQVVARYDAYQPAQPGARAPDLLSAGANVTSAPFVRIQLTGGLPIGSATPAAPAPRGAYATLRLQFAVR